MPYFQKRNFINKSINSVLKQTYKNFELIIIYDDDNKEDLIFLKKFCKIDKRIKILVNKKQIGAGESRNVGISKAKGEYIAFLDADDLWNKNKLKKQLLFMKNDKIKCCHTSYNIISGSKIIGQRFELNDKYISVIAELIEPREEKIKKKKKPRIVINNA